LQIPKRKPKLLKNHEEETKPAPAPKKFVTFSQHDSWAIEAAYQKLADEYDDPSREIRPRGDSDATGSVSPAAVGRRPNTSMNEAGQDVQAGGRVRVPVHEDFLFDVDIEQRELSPVYWLGPIYEVRRGSWFYSEGSSLRPCDENLAAQLEEGYLKIKPFRYPKSQERSRPTSLKPGEGPGSLALSGAFGRTRAGSNDVTPRTSQENLRAASQQDENLNSGRESPVPSLHQPQTYRLFGTYMNSIVTYQDTTTAWLSANDILSRVSSTMYQKFAGGGYLGGVKLVRGYSDTGRSKEFDKVPSTPTSAVKSSNVPPTLQLDERQQKLLKRRSAPPSTTRLEVEAANEATRSAMSSLTGEIDQESEAEAVRKRDEKEIQNDYNEQEGENQGREIEHLILVTHGIGQRLGMRYVNQRYSFRRRYIP